MNTKSQPPMSDGQYVSILTADRPGSTPKNSMVLVESADTTFRDRVRRIGHLIQFVGPAERSMPYDKLMRAIKGWTPSSQNRDWLSIKEGQTLHTCQSPRYQPYDTGAKNRYQQFLAYEAQDDEGCRGFVMQEHVVDAWPFKTHYLITNF